MREFAILSDVDYVLRRHRGEDLPKTPRGIPWNLLEPHEAQAYKNHGRDLHYLAMHGGLYPAQVAALLFDMSDVPLSAEEAIRFLLALLVAEERRLKMLRAADRAAQGLGFRLVSTTTLESAPALPIEYASYGETGER